MHFADDGDGNWGGKRATYDLPEMKQLARGDGVARLDRADLAREYGGGGLSPDEAKVLRQELAALKLPPPLIGFGLEMIGPTLLRYGTEAQKRRAPAGASCAARSAGVRATPSRTRLRPRVARRRAPCARATTSS